MKIKSKCDCCGKEVIASEAGAGRCDVCGRMLCWECSRGWHGYGDCLDCFQKSMNEEEEIRISVNYGAF
jgi:hypothetical protein